MSARHNLVCCGLPSTRGPSCIGYSRHAHPALAWKDRHKQREYTLKDTYSNSWYIYCMKITGNMAFLRSMMCSTERFLRPGGNTSWRKPYMTTESKLSSPLWPTFTPVPSLWTIHIQYGSTWWYMSNIFLHTHQVQTSHGYQYIAA